MQLHQNKFTGIYREELPFQFLQIVTEKGRGYVFDIYKLTSTKYNVSVDKNFRPMFVKCLMSVKSWDPKTKYQEVQSVVKKYPYIQQIYEHTYKKTFYEFCKTLHSSPKVFTIPIFDDFFVLFLTKLVDEPAIQNIDIGKITVDQFLFICMTVTRTCFLECIQYVSLPQINSYEQETKSVLSLTEANMRMHDRKYNQMPSPTPSRFTNKNLESEMPTPEIKSEAPASVILEQNDEVFPSLHQYTKEEHISEPFLQKLEE
jgi:hypothetical protein